MEREFQTAKKAIGNNILLNSFDVNRRSLIIKNASGEGFGHILMQKKINTSIKQGPRTQTMQRENQRHWVGGHTGGVYGSEASKEKLK